MKARHLAIPRGIVFSVSVTARDDAVFYILGEVALAGDTQIAAEFSSTFNAGDFETEPERLRFWTLPTTSTIKTIAMRHSTLAVQSRPRVPAPCTTMV